MSFAAKDANGNIVQIAQPITGPGTASQGTLVTLPTDGSHAKAADIATLQSALLTAIGLLATDQDVMATNAKLEAIRLLLASPAIPAGASTSAKQDTGNASLTAIVSALSNALTVQGSVTVSDGSGPLTVDGAVTANLGTLNGAATAAKQDAASTALALIDTDLNAGLGTDGASPPAFPGGATGVRGWLRFVAASDQPVQGVIDMPTASTAYTAGRGVEVAATAAGSLTLTYADGSTRTRTFAVGTVRLPDAVTKWSLPNGSTFVGTLCNLV